jgi:hypothetical protein
LNFGEGVALQPDNQGVFATMTVLPAAIGGKELTIAYTFADGSTFTEVKTPSKDLEMGVVRRISTTIAAENLVPAYKSGDKAKLELIANKLLPELKEATLRVYEGHRAFWLDQYKEIGWSRFDVRYGGIMTRCDTASHLINEYLSGRLERLDSLEEERRAGPYSGFTPYNMIKAPFFL